MRVREVSRLNSSHFQHFFVVGFARDSRIRVEIALAGSQENRGKLRVLQKKSQSSFGRVDTPTDLP